MNRGPEFPRAFRPCSTRLSFTDGSVHRYHHEDGRWPQAVTGITDEAGARYGTYSYDAQGRVTRSELSGGARLDFAYARDAGGKPATTVTDYSGAGGAATTALTPSPTSATSDTRAT